MNCANIYNKVAEINEDTAVYNLKLNVIVELNGVTQETHRHFATSVAKLADHYLLVQSLKPSELCKLCNLLIGAADSRLTHHLRF